MAKDTKTINVHPDNEVGAINFFQNFGWELFSTQEVKNSSSHLKESMWTGDIMQVTEREHYIKLTFQRDNAIPNYSRLVQLENEYNTVYSPPMPKKPSWLLIIVPVIATPIISQLVLLVPVGIAVFVVLKRSYRRKLDEYNNAEAIEIEQKQRILSECRRLI